MNANSTPCSVFFNMMKRYGGISYKELASLILSGKPLSDGQSPVSRINDRSWLSRFIVHAPVGSLQDGYFSDFTVSALRVVARLKSKRGRELTSEQIIDMICRKHTEEMENALRECHQDAFVYRNMLQRLLNESEFTEGELAEIAMVLLLTTGCTADVKRAAAITMDFAHSIHGQRVATPFITPSSKTLNTMRAAEDIENVATIGLLRVVDDYVVGAPYWIPSSEKEAIIGSISTDGYAITDVESDVSSQHARVFYDADGNWYAEDLDSLNGTRIVSGANQEEIVVALPRNERDKSVAFAPVQIQPGDKIILGANTTFVVLEGAPAF